METTYDRGYIKRQGQELKHFRVYVQSLIEPLTLNTRWPKNDRPPDIDGVTFKEYQNKQGVEGFLLTLQRMN